MLLEQTHHPDAGVPAAERVAGLRPAGESHASRLGGLQSGGYFPSWALTAEFGCLRLERLSGDEEVTGQQLFLPLPADYDYGIVGTDKSPETTRAIFGLLPSELDRKSVV